MAAAALCALCCAALLRKMRLRRKARSIAPNGSSSSTICSRPSSRAARFCRYRDDESNARTVKVGVYEVHDKACGGDPDVMHRLFDLEIDLTTGAAKWDNNFPDMEMRPVPQRATLTRA